MPQNTPKDEKWLLRRLADLERRVAALETSPRVGNTSVSGGTLTVGAPDSPNRIELDAAASEISFTHADLPAGQLRGLAGVAGGVEFAGQADAGVVLPFETSTQVSMSSADTTMQVVSKDGSGVQDSVGEVSLGFVYSGTSNAPQLNIASRSTSRPDRAIVYMNTNGGLVLYNYARTTDPPAPGADNVVLYVKGGRLYYRDGGGTVRGPL